MPKANKLRKRVLKGLLIAAISFAAIIGLAAILLFTQQQRLTNLAITELNKQFKGELTIERSNIDLFKNFPYVSIGLHAVKFYGNKQRNGKPIYQLEHAYAGFSLPDIFKGKYNVRRIVLRGGYVELVRGRDGKLNITEAKNLSSDTTTAPSTDTSDLEIHLKKMVIRDLNIAFTDRASGRRFSTHINKLTTGFSTTADLLDISLETDMLLDMTSPTDTTFFRHKKFELDIAARYDKIKQQLALPEGGIQLEQAKFTITGTADLLQKLVDFKVHAAEPDMKLVSAFIPQDLDSMLRPFKYDATLYLDGIVKGHYSDTQLPLIEVTFGCKDAYFHNTGADRKVDQVGFSGFYTNGPEHSLRTSELRMTNVLARPGQGIFDGNFIVRDFTDPKVIAQLRSQLELQFIGEFLGIPDLEHISGTVKLDMNLNEFTDLSMPEQALHKLKDGVQSELTVTNLSFSAPNVPYIIRDLDMHAEMRDNKITLDTMRVKMGNSDLRMNGAISDLSALLHGHDKPVTVTLNASSDKLVLKELFAYDTALARKLTEEVNGFNIGVSLATSVKELRHPSPLPRGEFQLKQLRASFKKYPHAFHDLGFSLRINDTALLLKDFAGMIDQSDFHLSGRVINYQLWFQGHKKGKTQVAFDFKSNRLAMADLLGPISKKYVPAGYHEEEASNLWFRARADLRYDTTFRFAKVKIANVSVALKQHKFNVEKVSGNILYGSNKIIKVDTLKGIIGRSDFDLNLRLYSGKDTTLKKRTNYLYFSSRFLDIDQLTGYSFVPASNEPAPATAKNAAKKPDSSAHAKAYNIFEMPFPVFEVKADIGRIKYNKLWIKGLTTKLRMQEDHYVHLDTLGMQIADGAIGMRGYLNGSDPHKIYFRSRIKVNDVDLEKLMIKLDHFGQDLVINKNIKGRITGNIRSHVQLHPDFVPLLSDSKAELDVAIYNGSLVDFAPMQAMAGYFKDKNLRNVRFDTLKNVLTFTNGQLNIPTMNINSSLGFMEISGRQSLDLKMEYYMRIPMKMVTKVGFQALFGRKEAEVDLEQVDEIEYRDKDKKVRFMNVKVSGTPDDFKVGLGKSKKS
ncbi:hypothetical protein MKQ68_11135 [Chitinophaga horti]|uniref:AsmA family protein n=1 Tax=Chitinophaga horti TaxID=2920382 RepID=A0ABY6J8K5_9BACT|nr:AsmA-like C-terminal region-containing protein [Chitinophaga horti]UYQ95656.1 hypothetical protein MKQ68_11135 [Chitinophaga horti]